MSSVLMTEVCLVTGASSPGFSLRGGPGGNLNRPPHAGCPHGDPGVVLYAPVAIVVSTGSDIINLLPLPGVLSTAISPPCAWVMWRTSDSPSPLPFVLWTSGSPAR